MSLLSPIRARFLRHRAYSTSHADFYASLLPAMIPVALLGSAVYMGLHLVQSQLAHEKFLDEANERIRTLEQEVDALQRQRNSTPVLSGSSKKSSWW